jgi:hypothetical protein
MRLRCEGMTILAVMTGGLEKVVDAVVQKLSTIFVVRWSIFTPEWSIETRKRKICHKLAQLQPPAVFSRYSAVHV